MSALAAGAISALSVCSAVVASADTVAPSATGTWTVIPSPNPGSTYSQLSAVSCPSHKACMAVGTSHQPGDSMFAEQWDGFAWTLLQIPSSTVVAAENGVLSGVSCLSRNACTAVGYLQEPSGSTVPLVEAWNGTTWTQQAAPVPSGSTSSVLSAVSCSSKTACTAVGYADVNPAGDLVTLAESWNGSAWAIQPTPNPAKASQLLAVSCTAADACMAVGSWQKPPPMGPRSGTKTLAEAWNGSTWTIEQTPPLSSSAFGQLSGVDCSAATACLAVGYSGLPGAAVPLADVWDGNTWTPQATPAVSGAQATQLEGVSCASATACTAVGATNFADSVQALAEAWNGKAWVIQPTPNPTANSLSAISCTGAAACTAVGYTYNSAGETYTTLVEAESATV